jgi:Holliday junction resolvase RusA-like endonuclease
VSAPILSLTAQVLGRPRAWPRTATVVDRLTGKTRQVNPPGYRAWKTLAAAKLAAFAGYRTFTGEVAVMVDVGASGVSVQVVALDPDDARRKPTGLTGDVDNYSKAVLDALEAAGVLADDVQVADLRVRFRP